MTIDPVGLNSLAQLSAERLLNCAAEGMLIAALAWFVLRAVGPRNSGTRFAVWFAALLGIAALPLLSGWASPATVSGKPSEITVPGSWALYIFLAWLSIASAGLLRIGIGFRHLYRVRKGCRPVDAADLVLRKSLEEFRLVHRESVQLCVSDQLRVPTAIGFLKPMVVIPSWMMSEASVPELHAILLHELAHLGRRDDWTNLIQRVLGALLFFHPAVWWINRKLSLEREMACDDLVLAGTTDPHAYADCLVTLAEKSFLRRGLALAQAAVGRLRHISLRVTRILDVNRPKATRIWHPAPLMAGGVSLLCLVAISHAPARLISFANAVPVAVTAIPPAPAGTSADDESGRDAHMGAQVVSAGLGVAKQPSPKFIPAKLDLAGEKSAVKPAAATRNRTSLREGNAHRNRAPKLVRASMNTDEAGPNTWVLMMQTRTEVVRTRHLDASGTVVWDFSVWQVTVVTPAQVRRAI